MTTMKKLQDTLDVEIYDNSINAKPVLVKVERTYITEDSRICGYEVSYEQMSEVLEAQE